MNFSLSPSKENLMTGSSPAHFQHEFSAPPGVPVIIFLFFLSLILPIYALPLFSAGKDLPDSYNFFILASIKTKLKIYKRISLIHLFEKKLVIHPPPLSQLPWGVDGSLVCSLTLGYLGIQRYAVKI